VQRDTNTDTPLPPDEPAGANPPAGAIIDYYLAHNNSAPVTIEILDARGQLVRRFSSADRPNVTEADLRKQLIPLYWLRPFRSLSSEVGMHRWVWDLHYAAPDSSRHEYPIAAIPGDTPRYPLGPTALPGSYTARLTANGKTYAAPFNVKMDTRVPISEAGLAKKFQIETRLAAILSETSGAVMQAGSIREPLQKLSQRASGPSRDAVQALQTKLAALLGAAGFAAPPVDAVTLTRVNGQVATLYGQVWQVDAEPTLAQSEAGAAIEHDASDAMKRWDAMKSSDLPALNRVLRGVKLPEVQIESESRRDETGMDEE
jgi:hypothetical protein